MYSNREKHERPKRIRKLYKKKCRIKRYKLPKYETEKLFNFGDSDFLRKINFVLEIKLQNLSNLIDFAA